MILCLQTGCCCSHIISSITCTRRPVALEPSLTSLTDRRTNEVSPHITSPADDTIMPYWRLHMHKPQCEHTDREGWARRHTTCDHAYRRGAHGELMAGSGCGRRLTPYGPHLWLRQWMDHRHARGGETYRNASLPCCLIVWLWLELKTESLWLIKNKYPAAHGGYKNSSSQIVQTQLQVCRADLASSVFIFTSCGLKLHLELLPTAQDFPDHLPPL